MKKTKNFPYAEMVRYGLVPATGILRERFEHVLSFLGVASFDALEKNLQVVFRRSGRGSRPIRRVINRVGRGRCAHRNREWAAAFQKVLLYRRDRHLRTRFVEVDVRVVA